MTSNNVAIDIYISSSEGTLVYNLVTYRLWSSNLTTFPPIAATGHKEWVRPVDGTFGTVTVQGSGPHRKFAGKW